VPSSFADAAAKARKEGRTVLTEEESKAILAAQGVRVTTPQVATSGEQAATIAKSIGFPVVLKVASTEITHKSDVGGVRLGLGSGEAVRRAYKEIMASVKEKAPRAKVQGVTVQPMAPSGGVEVIIGVTRDAQFGPVLMFGIGGVAVEVLQDVAFRIVPLAKRDAQEIVREIKGFKLLTGYRNTKAVDLKALEELISKVSDFADKTPGLAEMDLNPVMAYNDGVVAVDARMVLTKE
jgi:acyl-CoA synthetase (NDP forming)